MYNKDVIYYDRNGHEFIPVMPVVKYSSRSVVISLNSGHGMKASG